MAEERVSAPAWQIGQHPSRTEMEVANVSVAGWTMPTTSLPYIVAHDDPAMAGRAGGDDAIEISRCSRALRDVTCAFQFSGSGLDPVGSLAASLLARRFSCD